METKNCCAYNATRGCYLSFKVTVADSVLQPLKVLKVLVKELALNAESGLWLTPLLNTPRMIRLFPIDLVYLDKNFRVIHGVELLPDVEFPPFNGLVASALILPLYCLTSTETGEGDQLIICAEDEIDLRIAELAKQKTARDAVRPVESEPLQVEPVAAGAVELEPLPLEPLAASAVEPEPSLVEAVAASAVEPDASLVEAVAAGAVEPEALPLEPVVASAVEPEASLDEAVAAGTIEPEASLVEPVAASAVELEPLPLEPLAASAVEPEALPLEPVAASAVEPEVSLVAPEPETVSTLESEPLQAASPPEPASMPVPMPHAPTPIPSAQIAQGTGFTVALHTSWRINNSTVPAVLPESDGNVPSIEAVEEEAPSTIVDDSAASRRIKTQEVPDSGAGIPSSEVSEPDDEVQVVEFVEAEAVQNRAASDSLEATFIVKESPELHEEVSESEGVAAHVSQDLDQWREQPAKRADNLQTDSPPNMPEPGMPDSGTLLPVASVIPASGAEDAISASKARGRKGVRKAETEGAIERLFPNQVTPGGAAKAAEPEAPALVKDKGPLSSRMKRWLNGEGIERRRASRLSLPGLIAFDATSSDPQPQEVGDVSPSGLYLRTNDRERWPKGELFSLALEVRGATDKGPYWNVEVRAGAVRWDEEGVGLSFKLPKGVDFHPWHGLHERRTRETEAEYFVREFRLAQALGFLKRISPPAVEEIRHMLYERLSNKRVANAVEIVLITEKILAKSENAGRMKAHPSVVVSIIENGSWAEIDWVQQLWAGLLVTSCTADGQDESNLIFADLLNRMTPIHLRILSAACRKGAEVISSGGSMSTMTLYCTAEELIEATGSHSLLKIQQTISHLSTFGLLADSAKSSYIPITEKTKTTPTTLGLQMHARCHGRR